MFHIIAENLMILQVIKVIFHYMMINKKIQVILLIAIKIIFIFRINKMMTYNMIGMIRMKNRNKI